jgi:alanine racemase
MNISATDLNSIATLTGAEWISKGEQVNISQVITDSRTVFSPSQALFIAIKGERHDGHQYIQDLYQRGIRNFLISDKNISLNELSGANILVVKDSLAALQQWAAEHRKKFDYPVIAITGSNGKTIVKEWLFQLLRPEFSIVRSPKSYNSQLGVPLSVLQMEASHSLAIFEAGISFPGEMKKLAGIIQPALGVFTTITNAHSENFESDDVKAAEKAILFQSCSNVIYNADNDIVEKAVLHLKKEHGCK